MAYRKIGISITALALIVFFAACAPQQTESADDQQTPTFSGESTTNTATVSQADTLTDSELLPPPGPDLRGQIYTLDEMDSLTAQYPNTEFIFSFELAGVLTDSTAQQLDLSGHIVNSPEDITEYLPYMPQLTYLDMCNCGLSNEEMETLRSTYPDIKFVWMLTLESWQLRTDTVAFSTLSSSANPVKLTSDQLDILKYCTDLVALDLGHHNIVDLSWAEPLTKLKVLILACNNITELTPLAQLKELRYLELFENRAITDISPLAQLPHLQDLNLGSCFNIEDFTPLLNVSSLERLWVNFTCITGKELSLFEQTLPNCYVRYLPDSGATDGGWRKHERYDAMRNMFLNNCMDPLFE